MTDPTRQELLRRLVRISELDPDTRFGQLVANLTLMADGPLDKSVWEVEDAQLLGAVRQLEDDLTRRAADVA